MSTELTNIDYIRDYWDWIQDYLYWSETAQGKNYQTRCAWYGWDDRRTEFHDAMCERLGLKKEDTKEITDNIDRFDCFESFVEALLELKKEKVNEKDI